MDDEESTAEKTRFRVKSAAPVDAQEDDEVGDFESEPVGPTPVNFGKYYPTKLMYLNLLAICLFTVASGLSEELETWIIIICLPLVLADYYLVVYLLGQIDSKPIRGLIDEDGYANERSWYAVLPTLFFFTALFIVLIVPDNTIMDIDDELGIIFLTLALLFVFNAGLMLYWIHEDLYEHEMVGEQIHLIFRVMIYCLHLAWWSVIVMFMVPVGGIDVCLQFTVLPVILGWAFSTPILAALQMYKGVGLKGCIGAYLLLIVIFVVLVEVVG